MRVTVGLAQMAPKLGDLRSNLDQHLALADQARAQGVDLLVFPELSLTGYQVMDLVPELAMRASSEDATFRALLQASHGLDLVVGFVHVDRRHRFTIAQAWLSGGACLHVHHKLYLPTYTMFDDGRYFARGDSVRAFETRFGRVGMLICEDFWHLSAPWLLWLDGADLLVFANSSPTRGISSSEGGRLTVARWVELMNQACASTFTNYVLMCNRVGYEDGKNFWGGSLIANPEGELVAQAPYFEETLLLQEIDLNQLRRTRAHMPLLRDERPHLVQRELARILRQDERLSVDGRMALAGSNAGMRLIAQCSLLKRGDEARLRDFLRSGYTRRRCSRVRGAAPGRLAGGAGPLRQSEADAGAGAGEAPRAGAAAGAAGRRLPALRADGRGGLSPPHHRIQSAGDGGGKVMDGPLLIILLICAVVVLAIGKSQNKQVNVSSRKSVSPKNFKEEIWIQPDKDATGNDQMSSAVNPYEEITWATPSEIRSAFERQRGECMFCGLSVGDDPCLDYIIPLTRGGRRETDNLAVSCSSCNEIENKRKRNREIWRMRARAGMKYPSKQEIHEIYKRQRQSNRMARMETDLSSFSLANLDAIYNHQNGHCNFCGGNIGKREAGFVSHIIPLAHGGKNSPENIAIVCNKCDQSRRAVFSRDWL